MKIPRIRSVDWVLSLVLLTQAPQQKVMYYNSSDNQLKFYDGSSWSAIQGSGTVEIVASGTLTNGQTVIVTSDGKVAKRQVSNPIRRSLTSFNTSGETNYISSDYDSSTGRLVIALG